ncbi:MAG TPA: hypothetical protein VI603_03790 [Saprospiraceae bacterium]|nr:hypothetical protein [Saprospiraceae bacterium]
MVRISSDWTLFYKIFLPTVWIVFFGVVTGVLLFSIRPTIPVVTGVLLFYIGGVVFLYFTLIPLKRVEGTEEHLYITNYFKTFRYTFESISKVRTVELLLFKIVILHFREKTSFGHHLYFIRRRQVWEEYLNQHAELLEVYVR